MGIFGKKEDKQKKDDKSQAKVSDGKSSATPKTEDKGKEKDKSMKDLYKTGQKTKKDNVEDANKNKKEASKKNINGQAYKVLLRPLITEKGSFLASENKYLFEVAKDTNKVEIAKAIEEVYGVRPVSVNIIRMKGKKTRYGRAEGKKKDWKKAIIALPKGEDIKIYEGV